MCPKSPRSKIIFIFIIGLSAMFGTLAGSEDFMKNLPVYEDIRCRICHDSTNPVPGFASLNKFGQDFDDNGRVWNKALADKDSDNDGYGNGVELGDVDGDGVSSIQVIRSNPGDPDDMPSSINQKTWGVIKNLFADQK